ncbi:hypothetical protein ABTP77_20770, partial [Acinetobacter baumannii]
NLMVLVESRRPLFQPTLKVQGLKAPLLLALQPALDALPLAERQALLALGIVQEALATLPEEEEDRPGPPAPLRKHPEELVKRLVGTFSAQRLEKEGFLREGRPLPEILQVARALV